MKLLELDVMRGPNCWSIQYPRLIVLTVEGSVDRVVLPVEGLPGGPSIGHVLAGIAIALQQQAGIPVGFLTASGDNRFQAVFEYVEEKTGVLAGRGAFALLSTFVK